MITYHQFSELPDPEIVNGLLRLHENIFGDADKLMEKMKAKPKVFIHIALAQSEVVGYKIGYELTQQKYYSWLGGVHEAYRGRQIASNLMKKQHTYLTKRGYQVVQTKTRNKWRNMLILNIQNGFDIVETFFDEEGIHKIVLEKKLNS